MKKINETNNSNNLSFLANRINLDYSELDTILTKGYNHGLCGSKNLGNTCYMNSSIACLSNCTELTTFFLSKIYKNYINNSNKMGFKGKLAKEWYALLKHYWKSKESYGNPSEIRTLIAKKYKKFGSFEQQDANEFIIIFLELLGEDLNEIQDKKYYQLKEKQPNETDIECAKRFWDLHLMRNNSIINDLFYGLNKSTIICPKCEYKSITYDPFSTISLLIPKRDQLKKLKYLNFSKDDISLYYVPKFSLCKTYKINIRVNKDISFNNIIHQIKEKIEDFPYEINQFNIISVVNRKLFKIRYNDEIFNNINTDDNKFNFIIEKDLDEDKEMIFIPLYIKIGNVLSSYPRGLYIYSKMTYKDMKKKIYIIVRKYIYSLIYNEKKYHKFDLYLKSFYYNSYDKNKENEIIKLIGEEFDDIELQKSNQKKILIFPYNILIQNDIDSKHPNVIFNGYNDNYEFLNNYHIDSSEDEINLLVKDLQNKKNVLIINIDQNSDYYRKSMGQEIDKCIAVQSNDYCKKDYYQDNNITLDDCLQLFNIEENLEEGNEWFCNNCKNHVKASKKIEFFYVPKIMIISLSRFKKTGSDYVKNEAFINFPLTCLNMNKYITFKDKKDYIYDIFGVVEHFGGRGGGHYTAICQNYDGNWYSYDDSNCYPSEPREVCTNNAYVLFYRRRDW